MNHGPPANLPEGHSFSLTAEPSAYSPSDPRSEGSKIRGSGRGQTFLLTERLPELAWCWGATTLTSSSAADHWASASRLGIPQLVCQLRPLDGLVSNGIQFHLTQWCPMEYNGIVQTVVETPTYLAIANKLFSEEERADIVALVRGRPRMWRSDSWNRRVSKGPGITQGNGKKWRARIVYIWRNEGFPVFLIAVFPKNEKENLSMAERNALKKRADSIFGTYRG